MNHYALDVATRHQIYINRYAGGQVKDALKYALQLNREIQRELAMAQTLEQARALAFKLEAVEAIIEDVISDLGDDLKKSLADFAEYETGFQTEYIDNLITATATAPAEQVIQRILAKPATLLVGKTEQVLTFSQMLDTFTRNRQAEVRKIIQGGIVNSLTGQQITSEIARVIKTRTRAQIESLVRTSVFHVAAESRAIVYQENAEFIEQEEWVSVLDSRTTITCASLDGELFDIGEGPQTPRHWRCRSVRIPVVKPEYDLLGTTGTRAASGSRGGQRVRNTTKYGDFLARQSKDFQVDMLGPKRTELFRKGGLDIKDFADDTGTVYTLDELRLTNPAAFDRAGL